MFLCHISGAASSESISCFAELLVRLERFPSSRYTYIVMKKLILNKLLKTIKLIKHSVLDLLISLLNSGYIAYLLIV